MKTRSIAIAVFVLLVASQSTWAKEGAMHRGSMEMKSEAPGPSAAMMVGNKFCPVSGEYIGDMKNPMQYEYKGKIYNFCCPACVGAFKKDPEKYIKIVQEEMKIGLGEHEERKASERSMMKPGQ